MARTWRGQRDQDDQAFREECKAREQQRRVAAHSRVDSALKSHSAPSVNPEGMSIREYIEWQRQHPDR